MPLKSYNFHSHSYTRENFALNHQTRVKNSNFKTTTVKIWRKSCEITAGKKSLSKDFKDVLSIKNVVTVLEDNLNRPWNECRSKPRKPSKKVLFMQTSNLFLYKCDVSFRPIHPKYIL